MLIYSIYSNGWMPKLEICNWHKLSIWFFINLFTLQTSKEFQNQNKMVFIANICKKMMWNCQLQYKLNVTVLLPCQYCREINFFLFCIFNSLSVIWSVLWSVEIRIKVYADSLPFWNIWWIFINRLGLSLYTR